MKTAFRLLFAGSAAALFSSCASSPSGGAYSQEWEAAAGRQIRAGAADSTSAVGYGPPPPPPPATSRRMAKSEYTPKARPGLGTEWGPERKSEVTSIYFTRDSSRPAGVGSIFYNDRAGAVAMVHDDTYHHSSSVRSVAGGIASLSVVDSRGRTLPAYSSRDRIVCIGETGDRYQLLACNHSDRRLEMVMTVDGLDVLDGKSGSFSKRGYILEPGDTYLVEGWRMSDSKVAAFRFSSVPDSYANQKHGDTRNVGVIGLAVFPEEGRKPKVLAGTTDPVRRKDANPFPGRYATPP